MADILIARVEERLLPGLSKAIEVKEIATPLTTVCYTNAHQRTGLLSEDHERLEVGERQEWRR